MHYYEVAPNQIIRANSSFFTYASKIPLTIGQLVVIEVGKKSYTGLILRATKKPSYDTKEITQIIEDQPLPSHLVTIATWMSQYYATHLANVLQTLLPRGIQKHRRDRTENVRSYIRDRTTIVLNNDQQRAVNAIADMSPGTALLHGVTGSGKTHVYIELAKRTLEAGRSVIVLVPEIALTSQLVEEFSSYFQDVVLTHSKQTEAERHLAWRSVLLSNTPKIIIGPRSALFMPVKMIGLIVIDEAHEPSFKQEQAPRYSALRVASILVREQKAKLILGSATPLIADYYLASQSDRPIITMNNLAKKDAKKPDIHIVNMTKRDNFKRHRFFSNTLLIQLEDTLAQGNQSLIFHNRRGSASTTLCEDCGWSASCDHCFTPLTLHADTHQLRCHICGLTKKIPTSCPECGSTNIIHKGIGTKLIESELIKLFPKKTIARFDGDNENGESVDQKYAQLYNGEIDIIIGTQVIAKGLDLPKLRTVGVIQADSGLSLPDFGASERTFQLLAQVVGRVGRSSHTTNVIVQSYLPEHFAVQDGLSQNYEDFYKITLKERQKGHFPPFSYLLKLVCVYKTEAAAIKNAKIVFNELRAKLPKTIEILGPTPSFYERQHDTYRWQLTLKSHKRSDLVDALEYVPPTHWQSELDPVSLL